MSARAEEMYDVLIAGGGPAGTSAAIHLARAGARVLLAEQKRFPRPKLCGEFITPECLGHFARLGVLDKMSGAGGRSVAETVFYSRWGRRVVVPSEWFGAGRGVETSDGKSSALTGGAALGLSRAEMDERLLRHARRVGVEVLEEAQATGLLYGDEHDEDPSRGGQPTNGRVRGARLRLSTDGGVREVRARVLIDATGRASSLSRRVACEGEGSDASVRRRRRAPLVAFKAHLEGASADERGCEIYFYRGGYGGLSPVEGGLSNLCFIVSAAMVRACQSDAERVMREVVGSNRRAAAALRGARVRGEWLSVALEGFGRREVAPARGLFAVGDAASFIDPFTGSGMLMALESGELLAGAISRGLSRLRVEAEGPAALDALAGEYRSLYASRFGARLRLCSWLRRAAFAPPSLVETAMLMLGASALARRTLARSTRS